MIDLFSDGSDFSEYNSYFCKSPYQTEYSLTNATSKCREDTKCAMISSLGQWDNGLIKCNGEDSEYQLCEKSTELVPNMQACTLWKKSNIISVKEYRIAVIY